MKWTRHMSSKIMRFDTSWSLSIGIC